MSELPIPELRRGPPWVMEEMVAAHLSGNNPDRIRREDSDHHASAEIVSASFPL